MGVLRYILILASFLLMLVVVFQQFADTLFLASGTRPFIFYTVPKGAAIAAIVFSLVVVTLSIFNILRSKTGQMLLLLIATVLLLLSSHRVVDDVSRGAVIDEWFLFPAQTISYPVPDGAAPTYSGNMFTASVETEAGTIKVFTGIPPWTLRLPQE